MGIRLLSTFEGDPMYLIAFLGGVLTVLSPCILPVVPFLFADANRKRPPSC